MVNSGTSALVCALTGVGVGPGDEVIVPGYTYIATPAAVIAVGAVPVIVDIDDSLGLDPSEVERQITLHTKAIVPVHMRGVPARLNELMAVAHNTVSRSLRTAASPWAGSIKGTASGPMAMWGRGV